MSATTFVRSCSGSEPSWSETPRTPRSSSRPAHAATASELPRPAADRRVERPPPCAAFVDGPLMPTALGSSHVTGSGDACVDRRLDGHQRDLRPRPRGAALMAAQIPYIITGVVALLVTVYLFVALLYPERF